MEKWIEQSTHFSIQGVQKKTPVSILTGRSAGVFAVHHLGAHVLQGAAHAHEHVIPALLQLLGQSEVDYLNGVLLEGNVASEHEVLELEIPVDKANGVDVGNAQ